MISLSNQVAIITGGSRGIGAATAILLARAGSDIVIIYSKNRKAANQVATEIRKIGKRAAIVQCKVENFEQCIRAAAEVLKKFHRIDILINSAGIWEFGEIGTMKAGDWERTININLNGTFNMCNAIIPIMKKQHYGRIINISSTAGQRGEAFHSHYAASKGGIIAFTKSIAYELIDSGIWVNCVAPGWVDTDMVAHIFKNQKKKKEILKAIPRGKIATPADIAGPILFLASDFANNIVGEVLNVNGGSVLCG